jgi:transcriptional regulator with XRE-family HTH domain
VTRIVDLHPDDMEARVKLRLQLRDLRRQAGCSQAAAAARAGITKDTWSLHERRGNNPLVASVQRYVRAVDHRLILRPDLPHQLATHPDAAVLADLAARASDPHTQDAYHLTAALIELAAYRRWVGITARELSARWGTRRDATAVCDLEGGTKEPLVGSIQRYARSLGGVLHLDLEPIPNTQN